MIDVEGQSVILPAGVEQGACQDCVCIAGHDGKVRKGLCRWDDLEVVTRKFILRANAGGGWRVQLRGGAGPTIFQGGA